MDTAGRQPGRAARIGSLWYFAVPLLTLGLLTFLPFLHAAIRLRRAWVWLLAFVFALVAGGVLYVSGLPEGTTSRGVDAAVVVVTLASMVVGITVLTRLRHEVYLVGDRQRPAAPIAVAPPGAVPAVDPAVQRVLHARAKRTRARELAAADPLMARELRIGRPDLPGDYDDGGLVDIASAPGAVIAHALDLSPEQAEGIVAVRDNAVTVEDLFSLADLPLSAWDRIRDRAVMIR